MQARTATNSPRAPAGMKPPVWTWYLCMWCTLQVNGFLRDQLLGAVILAATCFVPNAQNATQGQHSAGQASIRSRSSHRQSCQGTLCVHRCPSQNHTSSH